MEERPLIQSIKRFFSGTLLSRISGMGRDLAMAFAFGDHPSIASFMVAFRLSNLFRRLLGEGPLQSAFIPQFEGIRLQSKEAASLFFRRLSIFIATLLLAITFVSEGIIAALWVSPLFSAENREILSLTALLFPAILFICLYGLNISLLNCYDSFFIPSFAPFICNVIWIGAAFSLRSIPPHEAMVSLSKWVAVGFFAQWLFTLPATLKHTSLPFKEWFRWKVSPEIKTLAASFSAGAIGVGAVQINAFIDVLFARYADIRGPAYLWYSIRLEQLALAIFGIACVSTIVPRLSRAIKGKDSLGSGKLFRSSYRRIMTVMIPCTLGIISVGGAAVTLLYGRGEFSALGILKTTHCFWAYGLGLIPTTLVILYSSLFYAKNNFALPMRLSLLTVLLNIALNALFVCVFKMGAVSTALATSMSVWINSALLARAALREGYFSDFSNRETFKLCAASFFAGCAAYGVFLWMGGQVGFRLQLVSFLAQSAAFLSVFITGGLLLRSNALLTFLKELQGNERQADPIP